MAIFNGKSIKGSIGPVSFTQKGNVSIIRSKPGKGGVKQTAATKNKAFLFGAVVSPMSKLLRQALAPTHLSFYDGGMVNRMNAALVTIINQHVNDAGDFSFKADSFYRLNGFNFNTHTPFNKSFLLNPKTVLSNGTLTLNIPEFELAKNVKFPVKAAACQIHFQLVLHSLYTGYWRAQTPISLKISKTQLQQQAYALTFSIPKGCLAVLAASLTYSPNNSEILLNNKSFHPAAILGAFFEEGANEISFSEDWTLFGVKLGLG